MPVLTRPAGPQPSNGSTVTFNGSAIGSRTGWSYEAGRAVIVDATTAASTVVGSGAGSRVLRQVDCVGIEPGKLTVRLLGCPPYSQTSIGSKATLSLAFAGGSVSGMAILESYSVDGAVGELLVGQATFQFTN